MTSMLPLAVTSEDLIKGTVKMRNPLLQSSQAFRLPDFSFIQPGQIMPAIEELLSTYRSGMESLLETGTEPGWAMVEAELSWADELNRAWSAVSHLNSVTDNEELRDAYNSGLKRLTEHENWRQQNQDIYRAYQALRRHLMEQAGATSVIPAVFDSGRVELRVDSRLEPAELMNRLVNAPPEGLRVEPEFADGRSIWIRVVELPGTVED